MVDNKADENDLTIVGAPKEEEIQEGPEGSVEENPGAAGLAGSSGKKRNNPFATDKDKKKFDHVIFLHTHNGCRLQGLFLRDRILEQGKALCLFDFHGSGMSSGTYVSFGWYETFDVDAVRKK